MVRAKRSLHDHENIERVAGQRWLIRKEGAYFPSVDEEVIEMLKAHILTDKKAIQLSATKSFTDVYGNKRRAGDSWLVTKDNAETHIIDVHEQFVKAVNITVLTSKQYCYIINPVDEKGKNKYGYRELRKGEMTFFLNPGEEIQEGIKNVYVLDEHQSLLVRTIHDYVGPDEKAYKPGEKFVVKGPCEYIPSVEL